MLEGKAQGLSRSAEEAKPLPVRLKQATDRAEAKARAAEKAKTRVEALEAELAKAREAQALAEQEAAEAEKQKAAIIDLIAARPQTDEVEAEAEGEVSAVERGSLDASRLSPDEADQLLALLSNIRKAKRVAGGEAAGAPTEEDDEHMSRGNGPAAGSECGEAEVNPCRADRSRSPAREQVGKKGTNRASK